MNFKNKLQKLFLLLLLIMPLNVFAYSDYIIVGGNNVGIEVNSRGIMVVGFYEVDGKNIGKNAGFILGDRIIKVADKEVTSINDMITKINENMTNDSVEFAVLREDKEVTINLKLTKDSKGVYKTGLYVKDQITGIGTLTYIDPNTKIFGALGHEIIESSSNIKIEVKDGKIFGASITGITKSTDTTTGEKNARFNERITYGKIKENTTSGIFGEYLSDYDEANLKEVAKPSDIVLGPAKILTVLEDNNIEEFDIKVLKVNHDG